MSLTSGAALLAVCFLSWISLPEALAVDHVPALLWSTHGSLWNTKTPSHDGHITSRHELHTLLQPVLQHNPKNLVLFLQDLLSVDDFTYLSTTPGIENPFHNVQEILNSSASSLVLPAVDWKAISHLKDYFQKKADWHLVDISDMNISDLEISDSKPNLIIVKLQSHSSDSDIPAASSYIENDKKIGKMTTIMKAKGVEFSAMYSAFRPSRIHRGVDVISETRRRLMATDTVATVPYPPLNVTNGTETCIIFYATNISLTVNQSVSLDLTNLTFSNRVDTNSSVCSSENTTFSLKYYNLTATIQSLEIRFEMSNQFYTGSARNWFTIDYIQIIQNGNFPGAIFTILYATAPAEYSFHCQMVGTSSLYDAVITPSNAEANTWNILITQFQIQAFNVQNSLFAYSTDCTGFFSAAIWMALVSCLVLLFILAYGIYMIMQLTTNEKFDDPKGQALSIPQSE